MKLVNNFLVANDPGFNSEFIGGDSEEMFAKSLKTMPENWYYRDVKINYSYNNLGFRCKNTNEIDSSNYILFSGCSHTEGIGLELEKTFPYLISNQLGMDYVNLAVSGSGIDTLDYNLHVWINKFIHKPKLIVIQYPDHSRFLSKYPGYDHFIESGSWQKDEEIIGFIARAEEIGLFHARKFLIHRLISHILNIPTLTVNFHSLALYDSSCLTLRRIDRARDLSHAGIKSHQEITNLVLDRIKLMNLL